MPFANRADPVVYSSSMLRVYTVCKNDVSVFWYEMGLYEYNITLYGSTNKYLPHYWTDGKLWCTLINIITETFIGSLEHLDAILIGLSCCESVCVGKKTPGLVVFRTIP